MVKHTQTICRRFPKNCFSVFDPFVGLALKRLIKTTELVVSLVLALTHFWPMLPFYSEKNRKSNLVFSGEFKMNYWSERDYVNIRYYLSIHAS